MAPQVEAHDDPLPVFLNLTLGSHIVPMAIFFLIPLAIWQLTKPRMHPMEPPLVLPRIPLIGHTLDLLHHGPGAWMKFHQQAHNDDPIISLPGIGTSKMYMATDPELVTSIFASQTLQFTDILTMLVQQLIPLSPRAKKDFTTSNLFTQWIRALHKSLASGPRKDELISRTLEDFGTQLDISFPTEASACQCPDIGMWIRDTISQSVLVGLLGDVEWARDREFIQACWVFEWDLDALLVSPLPSLTHPKASKATKHVVDALHSWLLRMEATHGPLSPPTGQPNLTNSHPQSSAQNTAYNLSFLAIDLLHIAQSFNWSTRDKATLLLFLIHVALSNLAQTSFWHFTHVYADKPLVSQLREEVDGAMSSSPLSPSPTSGSVHPKPTHHMIRNSITPSTTPLLFATFQETQRLVNSTPLLRYIPSDTTIRAGKEGREFLLKKGGFVFVPRTILSHESAYWGSGDTHQFIPGRFMARKTPTLVQGEDGAGKVGRDIMVGSVPRDRGVFFPFGGGRDICPARHLATSIVLGIMATLLTTVDIDPEEDSRFETPGSGPLQLTTVVWRIPRETSWKGKISRRKLA